MKKIVFLGAKKIGYECFQFLLEKARDNKFIVAALLTSDVKQITLNADLKRLAEQASVPILMNLESLIDLDYDILISVQYHQILKLRHIQTAKEIAVNLHMAPLPEYRGCNQFSFAILDGIEEFGTTIHKIESGIDSGDILFERRFPLGKEIFVEELYNKTYEESVLLFKESLEKLVNGDYILKPQWKFENRRKGFHLRNEINEIKKIDLDWPKDTIERHIRATAMPGFEGPYCMLGGRKIKLVPE